jgi:uncharacterized protein
MKFVSMSKEGLVPEIGGPAPGRLIFGTPVFSTWPMDEADGLYAGLWQSTPGKWRIVYDEWEYCLILEGHSVITSDEGPEWHVRRGDRFILKPGFRGTWEVVETTLKDYVIRI